MKYLHDNGLLISRIITFNDYLIIYTLARCPWRKLMASQRKNWGRGLSFYQDYHQPESGFTLQFALLKEIRIVSES